MRMRALVGGALEERRPNRDGRVGRPPLQRDAAVDGGACLPPERDDIEGEGGGSAHHPHAFRYDEVLREASCENSDEVGDDRVLREEEEEEKEEDNPASDARGERVPQRR